MSKHIYQRTYTYIKALWTPITYSSQVYEL